MKVPEWNAHFFRLAETLGSKKALSVLEAAGVSVNDDGLALVYHAVQKRDIGALTALIAAGANVHTPEQGYAPIALASIQGDVDSIQMLVAAGAHIEEPTYVKAEDGSSYCHTPLILAVDHGQANVVAALCCLGANKNVSVRNMTPLSHAAGIGDIDVVRKLLAASADVNMALGSFSPLMAASSSGHLNCVRILLSANANPNVAVADRTSLIIAASKGHTDVIRELCAAGADVNWITPENETPIYKAALNGYADAVRALCVAGSDVDGSTLSIYTPLFIASLAGHADVIRELLIAGANVHGFGASPMFAAASRGHVDVIKLLHAAGADVNMRTSGNTISPRDAKVQFLADSVDSASNPELISPLFGAVLKAKHLAVAELLKLGANIDECRDGLTPLVIAQHNVELGRAGSQKVLRILKEQSKNEKEKQKRATEHAKAVKEAENKELLQCKTVFIELLTTKRKDLEALKHSTKSFADKIKKFQTEFFARLIVMTEKLAQPLEGRKNNERLRGLEKNSKSLNDWMTFRHQLQSQGKKVEGELRNFSQLLKELQSTETGDRTSSSCYHHVSFSLVSEVRSALVAEITPVSNTVLKSASADLHREWNLVLGDHGILLALGQNMDSLNTALIDRMKVVEGFRIGTDNGTLSQDVLAKIHNISKYIQETIASQRETDAVMQAAQALARSVKKITVRTSPESPTLLIPHTEVPVNVVAPTQPEPHPQVGLIQPDPKEHRRLIYVQMRARKMEELKVNAERAAIDFHLRRTVEEIEAKQVPIPERKPKFEEIREQNSLSLRMYLDSLGSLVAKLKLSLEWPSEAFYALLGSLAQVNEVIVQEHKDASIRKVAKRLRNVIFKQHKELLAMFTREQLLQLSDCWHAFVKREQHGSFRNEEAVLQSLQSELLQSMYEFGKCLDIESNNEADHWRIVTTNIDIRKSIDCINQMQAYWKSRETRKNGDDLINHAADDFYWAIMGSELVALTEAARQGRTEAVETLASLADLTPYLSEFRDRGVFARHPLTRLVEERSNVLLLLENASEYYTYSFESKSITDFEVNIEYVYEDIDIQAILASCLQAYQEFSQEVRVLTVDFLIPSQLKQHLEQDRDSNWGERTLLVACNLGRSYWVGVCVKFNAANAIVEALYVDSIGSSSGIFPPLEAEFRAIYPKSCLKVHFLLVHADAGASAVCVVENLLLCVKGSAETSMQEHPLQLARIRRLHLENLASYNPIFFTKFKERQRTNRPTTASIQEQLYHSSVWFSKYELRKILKIFHLLLSFKTIDYQKLWCAFRGNAEGLMDAESHIQSIRLALREVKAIADTICDIYSPLEREDAKAFRLLLQLMFDSANNLDVANDALTVGYPELIVISQSKIRSKEVVGSLLYRVEQVIESAQVVFKVQEI